MVDLKLTALMAMFYVAILLPIFVSYASTTPDNVVNPTHSTKTDDATFSLPSLDGVKRDQGKYQAEINKLLDIIVKSLYSNRDVFVRELISNAADALDKIRYLSLTDPKLLGDMPTLEIRIRVDKENKRLYIRDTGIGMSKEELSANLGNIAKSGTAEFLKKAAADGALQQIGQFGVGFYSSFLVADRVTVTSKSTKDDQYIWESTMDESASFTVVKDPRGNTLGRGTLITLHLKDDAFEYLDAEKLQGIVDKYNEFINFPVYLWKSREVEIEEPKAEEKKEEGAEKEDVEVKEEEEEKKPPAEKKKETIWEWIKVNNALPIWRRPKSEITQEEYNEFYKNVLKDYTEPLEVLHFKAEGDVEFTGLIYIPKNPPNDMMRFDMTKALKLYVKRVFITDEFRDLLPSYLNFLKGIIDSDDLPLNVSREMLQHSKTLEAIKKKLIRKIIALFQDMATEKPEVFDDFYAKYSTSLKLGVIQDGQNKERLAKLLRFPSAKNKDGKKVTFEDYVAGMKKDQEVIYYLGGESVDALRKSPHLERLVKRGYEVLLLSEPIDEYMMSSLDRYDRKFKFVDVSKEGLKLKEDEDRLKPLEEEYKPLTDYISEVLADSISKATVSIRLAETPVALVSTQYGYSANMERVMKAQALRDERYFRPDQKHVLEINPRHPVIKKLLRLVVNKEQTQDTADSLRTLHDMAVLNSGFSLKDSQPLSSRINRMMAMALNMDPNEPIEHEVFEEEAPHASAEASAEASEKAEL